MYSVCHVNKWNQNIVCKGTPNECFFPIDTVIYYLVFHLFFSIQQQYINWKDNIVKININLILEGLLGLGVLLI